MVTNRGLKIEILNLRDNEQSNMPGTS